MSDTSKNIVFLHGFTGSGDDWTDIATRLNQQGYTALRPTIIGHGQTSSGSWEHLRDYDMALVAKRLKMMLPERFHLVGYSMGGRLALYIATHYPEIVDSLTLVSASPGLKTEAERTERQARDNELADKIEAKGMAWFADFWEQLSLWDSQSDQLKAQLRQKRLHNHPIGLANSLRGMGTGVMPSLWDDLSLLPMPVKLIVGEHDTKFVAINQEMAAKIPAADLTIIKNAGHACHLEQARKFTKIVATFLNDHPH